MSELRLSVGYAGQGVVVVNLKRNKCLRFLQLLLLDFGALLIIFLSPVIPAAAEQSKSGTQGFNERPVVLVSIAPQKFFVDQLAAELVSVETLIPSSVSVETYEPTIRQMSLVSHATVYLMLGHPNFPFEQLWSRRLGSRHIRTENCAVGMPLIEDDPHIWVSPFTVQHLIECTARALKSLLPRHVDLIEQRLGQLIQSVDELRRKGDQLLEPLRGRSFIIHHPELGYLAKRYQLNQLSLEHEGKEISAKTLMSTISVGKSLGIKVVLAQPQYAAREAESVAKELGATVKRVDLLAYDWIANTDSVLTTLADALRYGELSNKN